MVTGNISFNRINRSVTAQLPTPSAHHRRPVLVIINAKTDPIGVLGPPLIDAGLTLISCDPTAERDSGRS